ncbi:MAG: hypothetical protein JSR53_14330 [Proteobacteria bacterium]|nr:hypothetical protein [Pseudomonadota bacterium]
MAGCGGGSDDTAQPPAPSLAAPTNFQSTGFITFSWDVTPGATRYELHADPDGSGPLAEIKLSDYSEASPTGFAYGSNSEQTSLGGSVRGIDALALPAGINASYRLRACNASGCGDFASVVPDIAKLSAHEFSSGYAPFAYNSPSSQSPLSKDGLTLAMNHWSVAGDSTTYLFGRASKSQPWQQQARLSYGTSTLSADGTTLAVVGQETPSSPPRTTKTVVYIYHRSGSTWSQQYLDTPSAPSACPQPCEVYSASRGPLLSADGNLLVVPLNFFSRSAVAADSTYIGAVATYVRNGAAWSPQALLETGGKRVEALALSGDGKTLVVNQGGHNPGYPDPQAPHAVVFTQQGNGTWSQQARIPVDLSFVFDISGILYSSMKLSDDGNTLAVSAWAPPADIALSCSPKKDSMYIALFARNGTAWQLQVAISRSRGYPWALAPDGNALFYDGELFTRSNGAWACP